jgi:hypothetical protein
MMDSFVQIIRQLLIGNTSSSKGGASPFKVQINFYIPIFEGQIDVDVVDPTRFFDAWWLLDVGQLRGGGLNRLLLCLNNYSHFKLFT